MRALIAFGFILIAGAAHAETRNPDEIRAASDASFRQGVLNKTKLLQARKDFAQATDGYLELHRQGVRKPALYCNLGNAAALADRWPEAIWAYHMGLKLDPNQADLREHLAFARGKVLYPAGGQGRLDADPWPPWLHRPSAAAWFVVFTLAYALLWLVGTCAVNTRKGWPTVTTMALILFAAVSGIALRLDADRRETDRLTPLVVIADNTPFYLGNGRSYEQHKGAPLLPRGLEARLLHRRGDWAQIRLSTGEIGWLPDDRVLVVEP